jgi:hypothetical protein
MANGRGEGYERSSAALGSTEEGKKKKGSPGLWANIHKRRKQGKRPKKPGEKGYPDAKTWKKLTKENEELLRSYISESIALARPLAWGRDSYSKKEEDPRYPGKMAWEIEHFEEFGEWPDVEPAPYQYTPKV